MHSILKLLFVILNQLHIITKINLLLSQSIIIAITITSAIVIIISISYIKNVVWNFLG